MSEPTWNWEPPETVKQMASSLTTHCGYVICERKREDRTQLPEFRYKFYDRASELAEGDEIVTTWDRWQKVKGL